MKPDWFSGDIKDITYRPMIRRDAGFIAELDRDMPGAWRLSAYMTAIAREKTECLVSEFNDAIAGFIILSKDKLTGKIERLVVSPPFRRLGIGTGLLTQAENLLEYRQPRIDVSEYDKGFHLFLKSRGYQCYGSVRAIGGDMLRFCLGKPISIPHGTYSRFTSNHH